MGGPPPGGPIPVEAAKPTRSDSVSIVDDGSPTQTVKLVDGTATVVFDGLKPGA